MIRAGRWRSPVRWLALLAVAVVAPFVLGSFAVFQLATALAYAPALLGLVIITGLGGQIALGNGAFFALGAYVSAVLAQLHGWPYLATLPLAGLLALAAGIVIAVPTLRLQGHFLAVVTLAIAVAAPQLFKHFESVTQGIRGINLLLPDPPDWLHIDATQRGYFLALGVTLLSLVATRAVKRGRVGRALRAVRDNETVAASLGIGIARTKIAAFGFSTLLAGLGGSVFAVVVGYVSPDNFTIGFAALLIIGLVVGGKESEWGALVGALFIVVMPVYAGRVDPALSGLGFAVIVLVVMLAIPDGLAGLAETVARRLGRPAILSRFP
jgi:branched-chain amino acid transport system permease protein